MIFRWGIFGTGAISAKFAAGLAQLGNHRVALIGSRSEDSAKTFASKFGCPHAIGGYEAAAIAAYGKVDAIYIATPPVHHAPHAIGCLEAGVPVLVEKPFAIDAKAASSIADLAQARGLFAMEAFWTRFMPAVARLRDLLADGAIDEPRLVTGSFGISNVVNAAHGNFDPARGGGALTHLGYYPVALGQALFGDPTSASAFIRRGETGVDEDVTVSVAYGNGVLGSFQASLRAPLANDFAVHGTHGRVSLLGPLYRPLGVSLHRTVPRHAPRLGLSRKDFLKETGPYNRLSQWKARFMGAGVRTEYHPYVGNGYHYQAAEVAACIRAGDIESLTMPLSDSISIAATLDRLRTEVRG